MQRADKPANFHSAHIRLHSKIRAAARSVALWKTLREKVVTVKRLNRQTCFLDAAMSAAWSSAIVHCYAFIDSHKGSLSLDKLLKLSAEIDPRTRKPFISHSERTRIQKRVNAAKRLGEHIKVLRHNEEAHISSSLSIFTIARRASRATKEIVEFLDECKGAFDAISMAAYRQTIPIPAYEREINDDLDIFFAVYPRLRGFG